MEAPITPICNSPLRLALVSSALLALTAGAGPALADTSAADLSAYVRARAADAGGDKRLAAKAYTAALSDAPDSVVIATRAYRAGLQAGDMALALQARRILEKGDVAPADAALLALADALANGDKAGMATAMKSIGQGPFAFLLPSIRAWLLLPSDPKGALAALDAGAGNPLGSRFANENRALIDIASGRSKDATALLQLLTGVDPANDELRINAAQLLVHAGEGEAARALLAHGGSVLAAYRDKLGAGAAPTPQFGVARLYLRLAGGIADGRAVPAAITLVRAAQLLEPNNDRGRLILAAAFNNDDAPRDALAELDHIAPDSPAAAEALPLRIEALNEVGRADEALKEAAALNASPGATMENARNYADLLIAADRFDDAARAYQTAIQRAGDDSEWTLHLQLGGALDQAGRWREAEPELEKAVALAPQSALALNYLGYARLEHGESPAAASKLLERATALSPDSAAILDSLAWSYYLQGDVARALPLLERAAAGEAANTTINEHLGDAYWAAGRRYEARYAWRAAAVTASADDGARLAGKIADGLQKRPR